ncbi:prepilin-type N-terminal cleavage/methylation domain-containing protein [Oscillibacter sp.]|uniref:type II secretion system protein n=1 Tax=Oscillibacter sp. TaxID=1945593 RepID=UPI0028963C72|nr:prepilin-type N-terminal cleavage/methylation domain-containing protein [Oscillibacter sp.]
MLQTTVQSLKAKKNSKKGFTLMEMLIVVAIIGVLVAISIPVFTSKLDDARKAADDANMRTAKAVYAVYMLDASDTTSGLDGSGTFYFNASTGKFQAGTTDAYRAQSSGSTTGSTKEYYIKVVAKDAPVWSQS